MAVENCAMRNLITLLCSPHITRVNKCRQRSRSRHGTGEQFVEYFGHEICRKRKYSRESGKKKNIYIVPDGIENGSPLSQLVVLYVGV